MKVDYAEPAYRDGSGHIWSRFSVIKPDGSRLMVRQCYFAVAGPDLSGPLEQSIAATPSWSTASEWYWSAARPGSRINFTLAVTVAEPLFYW